jgi:ubiquinone biosynthesis protein UbiJ
MDVGEILALVLPILAVSGGLVLAGFKGWSNHKLKMREAPDGDTERLFEAMQQLHDEVGSVRDDVAELQERMDFTERVLSEVKSRNAIGPGDATQVSP